MGDTVTPPDVFYFASDGAFYCASDWLAQYGSIDAQLRVAGIDADSDDAAVYSASCRTVAEAKAHGRVLHGMLAAYASLRDRARDERFLREANACLAEAGEGALGSVCGMRDSE